uniref:Uncharacterized protein n=1 Tax=Spironucleus salmonicida TaxID=348837 RepID=V6LJT4_9EUKA|eukprot:EST44860.1 Hypothetical protein SS50377_15241 [Spironucleus salmonicida]
MPERGVPDRELLALREVPEDFAPAPVHLLLDLEPQLLLLGPAYRVFGRNAVREVQHELVRGRDQRSQEFVSVISISVGNNCGGSVNATKIVVLDSEISYDRESIFQMWQGIIYKNQCIILCKCLFVKRVLLYFVYILKNELCSESLRKGKSFINEYRKICRRWECTVTCLWSLVCSLAGKSQCITVIGGIILKKKLEVLSAVSFMGKYHAMNQLSMQSVQQSDDSFVLFQCHQNSFL